MGRLLIVACFLFSSFQNLYSQKGSPAGDTTEFAKGSGIVLGRLSSDEVENLSHAVATAFAKFPLANLDYSGSFSVGTPIKAGKRNADPCKGRVIILVNEHMQSSAEFHTMAFKAPGALVVGSTTAGADGTVTNIFSLPGGMFTRCSGIGVLFLPDVEVKRTVKGTREGGDELVDRAIDLIHSGARTF